MPASRAPIRTGPFHWPLALGAGALCELVSSLWVGGAAGLGLLVTGYVLLIGFAARNLVVTGSVLVIAGLLANLTVMVVDGGMPVRGLPPTSGFGPRHHGERPGDHLVALGDVIAVRPLGEVFSAGDLVLAAGVATMLVSVNAPGWRRRAATASGRRAANASGRQAGTASGRRAATASGRRAATASGRRAATASGRQAGRTT